MKLLLDNDKFAKLDWLAIFLIRFKLETNPEIAGFMFKIFLASSNAEISGQCFNLFNDPFQYETPCIPHQGR